MSNAALDHIVSLTIFIAALLIFMGLFSQTIQTGLTYQQHNALSTKTSDLLDTILLNTGDPENWGQSDQTPISLGLQNYEFTQYILSSYSPTRLYSTTQPPVYYYRTDGYYSNLTAGFGGYLLAPQAKSIDYRTAAQLLGINGTYGFQLTLTPTISFQINKISSGAPLTFSVDVAGTGSSLSNAPIYCDLILVNQDGSNYPSYNLTAYNGVTDGAGSAVVSFSGVNGETQSYAFLVYSYLDGLKGMGYYVHVPSTTTKTIVPLVDSFESRNITIAHGDSVGEQNQPPEFSQLNYNASFVILTEDYTLRSISLDQGSAVGSVFYGSGSDPDFASITVPDNEGILIVTYKDTVGNYGLVLMPWGLGSMAFPMTFGGDPSEQSWVTTDLRQVTISGMSYQARLALWSLQGGS